MHNLATAYALWGCAKLERITKSGGEAERAHAVLSQVEKLIEAVQTVDSDRTTPQLVGQLKEALATARKAVDTQTATAQSQRPDLNSSRAPMAGPSSGSMTPNRGAWTDMVTDVCGVDVSLGFGFDSFEIMAGAVAVVNDIPRPLGFHQPPTQEQMPVLPLGSLNRTPGPNDLSLTSYLGPPHIHAHTHTHAQLLPWLQQNQSCVFAPYNNPYHQSQTGEGEDADGLLLDFAQIASNTTQHWRPQDYT